MEPTHLGSTIREQEQLRQIERYLDAATAALKQLKQLRTVPAEMMQTGMAGATPETPNG
jgi:hypothetical protein